MCPWTGNVCILTRAPTAIGQKSLGVPSQVNGVRNKATIAIHWQRLIEKPTQEDMMELDWDQLISYAYRYSTSRSPIYPMSCAISTMNTHPPP